MYSEIGLAAGACSGNGILMDISDPRNPKRLDFVFDKGFAYWHSATFNNDGTKVLFTDEWGGGGRPRCRAVDPLTWGADAIYDIVDKKMVSQGLLQDAGGADRAGELRRAQRLADPGARPRHHGAGVVPGRPVGVRLHRFRERRKRSPTSTAARSTARRCSSGGYWSTYWYNGNLYGAEMARGIDVFRLKPSEFLSQNEIDAAMQFRLQEFNSQNQPKVAWPPSSAVAKAYVDQLNRIEGHLGRARQDGHRRAVEGRSAAHRQGRQRRRPR